MKKYYIYHIPGKKIGVTTKPIERVEKQQGYKDNEYEILFTTDCIDAVSKKEIELQHIYGYKIDRQLYKNLINTNNMKINITEQTTTFPMPANKLKGRLTDLIGFSWETSWGEFKITAKSIPWIINNLNVSMYNKDRCFIYNKAFYESINQEEQQVESLEIFNNIRQWARDRGIYDKGDERTQYVKLQEEAGELAKALLKNDQEEVKDAIGDIVVVLTNLAKLRNLSIESCINSAYNVIINRTGKMVNGTFIKDKL